MSVARGSGAAALLVVHASLPGTSRSVTSWVQRLTKTERLRQSLFTAATGRRAVEHPPQPGSIGEGDSPSRSSMSQAIFQHRVAGDEGVKGRLVHDQGCQL